MKSIILTPVAHTIDPRCEQALHALERRGYTVRRVYGYSAIDLGRCVLASEALAGGYDELMWIDSDIGFVPEDVERLRSHQLPISCGIYLKKSAPDFACEFLRDTKQVVFGKEGGLSEIRYSGFGFVHTRREVYETMRTRLQLDEHNQRLGNSIVPYFMPMSVPDGEGKWYLSEDYAFCERARQCGFKIMADSTIHLSHIGSYGYAWEDMAHKREKLANLTVSMQWGKAKADSRDQKIDLNSKS